MYFNLRLFSMTKGFRGRIFLGAFLGLLAVLVGIGRLALTGWIIARLFQGDELSTLVSYLIIVAGLIVVRVVLQYFRDYVSYKTATDTKIELRRRLYLHALALGPGHFDQMRTGDILVSLVDGVENLEVFFGQYIPQFIVAVVAPILIFVFMAILDIQISIIFLVFAVITLLIPNMLRNWNISKSRARRNAYGALAADFLDSVQGLATLKAFGQAKRQGQLLARRARELYRTTMGVVAVDGASNGATILGIAAGSTAALVLGGYRVNDGSLELSILVIVLMLGGEIFRPLREMAQLYHQGMTAMSSAEGIFNLLDTPVTISQNLSLPSPSSKISKIESDICFDSVSFAYNDGSRPALNDLSFTIHEGQTIGLVGASGAGKSTIVSLLLRFYDPQRGRILIGGQDICVLPLELLRDQISVVTQDTYLFHGTVAENLRLGMPDATQSDLEDASRLANIHDFIVELPSGYETVVGERGIKLSGGQRQRIAIARALLKSAPILILDEALSSVDAENEAVIQEALDHLIVGKTTLVIAHRLSSVINCDSIMVLDDGNLVENGTHQELSIANGAYFSLMSNQQILSDEDIISDSSTSSGDTKSETFHKTESNSLNDNPELLESKFSPLPISIMSAWSRLLSIALLWKGRLSLTVLLGLAFHISPLALGAIGALLVAEVFRGGDFGFLVILLVLATLLSAGARWGENWASHDMAYRLLAEMRIEIYHKLEPLFPAYMVRRRSGDLTNIIGSDVENVENFFAHLITPAIVSIVVPGIALISLVIVAPILALVLLPFLLIAAISPFYEQKRSEKLGTAMREQLGEMNAHMVDSIQGIREIVAFGAGHRRVLEIVNRGVLFSSYRVGFLQAQAFHRSLIEALTAIGGLTVLSVGALMSVNGQMDAALLPLITLLSLTSFGPVTELAGTLVQLMDTLASTRRIFSLYDEPIVVRDGPGVTYSTGDHQLAGRNFDFSHVSFSYDVGLPEALTDVTFSVESGQTVALVGSSGAGKSTTANMLLRFWDPDDGFIRLGTNQLTQFKLDDLRQNIAMVSQDTYLFNASIRDNLKIANLDATDEEIDRVAKLANVDEFSEALPDGYDTFVGERGVQLSGGQRQRVSIARALLKDAAVLILDEATSHLDAVNEQKIREALDRLMDGRTTLVIAHRLSTVRQADRIIVLDSGKIVEEGTHSELLKKRGIYSNLVSKQIVTSS